MEQKRSHRLVIGSLVFLHDETNSIQIYNNIERKFCLGYTSFTARKFAQHEKEHDISGGEGRKSLAD